RMTPSTAARAATFADPLEILILHFLRNESGFRTVLAPSLCAGAGLAYSVVNAGMVSDAAQLVSGCPGVARKDATTACMHACAGASGAIRNPNSAPCPAPGTVTVVEFVSVPAA